ncbi:MAG: hypothetical protein ACLU77_00930 [Waltera sp.]
MRNALELDEDCSFCHGCVHPVCQEMEMVRILQMLKGPGEAGAAEADILIRWNRCREKRNR